ncbi:MAG: bifunctional UDP-N-acetylglucosamine diphosphorylase/glucosamine-1-phosphate N-acetyltransferase GlmU [Vulcanimicrobiaceae bacterium]
MSLRAIVLAAGKGTRMRSGRPKVLHTLCGRPMLWWVLRALRELAIDELVVVTSADLAPQLAALAADAGVAQAVAALQEPQLGTGDATRVALERLAPRDGTVLVLNGDMPLVELELVRRTLAACDGAGALVTARLESPGSFGRIVRRGERVERIVEARDASAAERAIDEINAGLYAFREPGLREALERLGRENAQREYYLTDVVAHFARSGAPLAAVVAEEPNAVLGVNDRIELAAARALLGRRLCEAHMRAGTTIVDPETTYLEPDLELAPDATIYPNTAIRGKSVVGASAEIGPNTRLDGARIGAFAVVTESVIVASTIGDYAQVGPYAHLRNGTTVGTAARIGNFVEIKASQLAPGVRAGHLTYLGDSEVGERSNVGAGTITCNFDGERKHRTTIGKDAFIGSNSSLVAPLVIGDGALTGAGSVVTRDVPAGARVAGNPARPLAPKPPDASPERS